VNEAIRSEVIDAVLDALRDGYVFPDVAAQMVEDVRGRQTRGEYDGLTSGRQFAQALTTHLRLVSRDLHLAVNLIPPGPPPPPPPGGGVMAEDRRRALAARQNFGFARVERLAGNVGYVDIREFMSLPLAAETAAAAMTFLAGTDALIIDMRNNRGGSPETVAFVTSYLFGPQSVHLNDFYNRLSGETFASRTLPYVPGLRSPDTVVYVLTGNETFSGAEEFSYNLKSLERATIVGETTAGAAHTVGGRRLTGQFVMSLPSGRPINPRTGTNWEGVGVEPDVSVPAAQALDVAHLMVLERREAEGDTAGLQGEISGTIAALRAALGDLASVAAVQRIAPVPASSADEDFESGNLDAWQLDVRGAGGWFVYTDGETPPEPSQSDPNFPFEVPDPPQGVFAAVSDMNGPGRRILYRDVALDGRYRLHLTVFYTNLGVFDPMAPGGRTLGTQQQYRIHVLAANAPVDSMLDEHVLTTVFEGRVDGPARQEPTEVTFDLSAWSGQTVRLRIATADDQGPLRAGVDDIRFESIPD
jgi:hypothetical protein